MRLLTSGDGDLISYFETIDESQNGIKVSSFKRIVISNHEETVIRGKMKGHFPLEHILGFCKTFKKILRKLGLTLYLETDDLQDFIHITIGVSIKINIDKLYLKIPTFILDPAAPSMFNESIRNS